MNVLSGNIGMLLDDTDAFGNDRSVVREVFGSLLANKSIKDCQTASDPSVAGTDVEVEPGVFVNHCGLTDFYGHDQQTYGTVDGQDTTSYSPVLKRNSEGSQYNMTSSQYEMFRGDRNESITVYRDSSLNTFNSIHQVELVCYRRTKWDGTFPEPGYGIPYDTIPEYSSSAVTVTLATYDYLFILQDVTP